MAIYPSRDSISLRKAGFDEGDISLIFVKIPTELEHLHSQGIIHNDLKMGNILLTPRDAEFKRFDTQLIDWNLATFYYSGYESSKKKGTICYHSPEGLFKTSHITPAADIWTLAVVMYSAVAQQKPFAFSCNKSPLKAIASLVGGKKVVELYKKYKFVVPDLHPLIQEMEQKPEDYPPLDLYSFKVKAEPNHVTEEFISVLVRMLEVDPELRPTAPELLQMPYFARQTRLPKVGVMKE